MTPPPAGIARDLVYRPRRGRSLRTMDVGDVWTPSPPVSLAVARRIVEMAETKFYPKLFLAKKSGGKTLIERVR